MHGITTYRAFFIFEIKTIIMHILDNFKDFFDNKFQNFIATTLILCGVILASICLFIIEPLGEIHNSAIAIVSEMLILGGALLGVNANFDHKLKKFEATMVQKIENKDDKNVQK